jgi:hypothetical protein
VVMKEVASLLQKKSKKKRKLTPFAPNTELTPGKERQPGSWTDVKTTAYLMPFIKHKIQCIPRSLVRKSDLSKIKKYF